MIEWTREKNDSLELYLIAVEWAWRCTCLSEQRKRKRHKTRQVWLTQLNAPKRRIEWITFSHSVHSRLFSSSHNFIAHKIHCGKFVIKTKRTTKRSKFYSHSHCARGTRKLFGLFLLYLFFLSLFFCVDWKQKCDSRMRRTTHELNTTNKCQNHTKRTDRILFFSSVAGRSGALSLTTHRHMCVVCVYRPLLNASVYRFFLFRRTHTYIEGHYIVHTHTIETLALFVAFVEHTDNAHRRAYIAARSLASSWWLIQRSRRLNVMRHSNDFHLFYHMYEQTVHFSLALARLVSPRSSVRR